MKPTNAGLRANKSNPWIFQDGSKLYSYSTDSVRVEVFVGGDQVFAFTIYFAIKNNDTDTVLRWNKETSLQKESVKPIFGNELAHVEAINHESFDSLLYLVSIQGELPQVYLDLITSKIREANS